MKFEYTAVVAEGMSKQVNELATPFAEILSERPASLSLGGPVEHLVFCPVILPAHLAPPPDHAPAFSRKRKSLFVSRNIQYSDWTTASRMERLRLYVSAFRDGVHSALPRHLKPADRILLLGEIEAAAECMDA